MTICWTPEMSTLLGAIPDQEIADRFGISASSVCARRKELGIPSVGHNEGVRWTSEMDNLLGTIPDRKLARQLGLSKQTVMYRRQALGIFSWREQNRVVPKELPWWSRQARRIYTKRRRHQEAGLVNTLTYQQWLSACRWFDNCCAYCGEKAFLTEDHLVPVSDKGPRTALNIVPACQSCNSSKRDKPAHIWIYQKFGMKEGKEIVDRIVNYLTVVQKGGN